MGAPLMKTPIGILEEFCSKKHLERPTYTIDQLPNGTFKCVVECLNKTATGYGNNKKGSKHDAAQKVLQLIMIVDQYSQKITKIETKSLQPVDTVDILTDFCEEHGLLVPEYKFEKNYPPIYIVRVTIEHLIAFGTETTPTRAREKAARNMLQMVFVNKDYLYKPKYGGRPDFNYNGNQKICGQKFNHHNHLTNYQELCLLRSNSN